MTPPTRERILDAAEELFAAGGYRATSVVQIAEAVGIRGPAIYKHFASKADLYEAVVRRLYSPLRDRLLVAADDELRSAEMVDMLVRYHVDNPNLPRLIQQATLADDIELHALVEDWYEPLFSRIGQTNDTPGLAMALHSMLLGYITLAPLHRRVFGVDPLEPDAIDEQLRLLAQLWSGAASPLTH